MNTIIPWLEHLKSLIPPNNVSLIGAGSGKGVWAQWLVHQGSQFKVKLIEADSSQYMLLQRTLSSLGKHSQYCEICNELVASQQGISSFFVTSSQQENSLLESQVLHGLWPNLQTKEIRALNTITLDTLLVDLSGNVEERHWLIIDCLPAGVLLQASNRLDLVDVIIARVLLSEPHAVPNGTSLEEVTALLQKKGMLKIAVEVTRHPNIGYALFVRDTRAVLRAQAKLLQEFQEEVEKLAYAKAVAEQLSKERALELELVSKARDEQTKRMQQFQEQIEKLIKNTADTETYFKNKNSEDIKKFEIEKSDAKKKLEDEYKKEIDQLNKNYLKQRKISELQSIQLSYIHSKIDASISINSLENVKRAGTVVVDCGGHDGCSAIKLRFLYPNAQIYTFEPNPDFWKYYELIPVKLFRKAVATFDGVIDIVIDPIDGDGSSYVKTKKIDIGNKIDNSDCPVIKVECIDLSQFLKNLSNHYDEIILKLDVEGAEYDILDKMIKDNSLSCVNKLYCEFHWEKIGMSAEEHNKILSIASNITSIEEWDALEFSVHEQKSSRLLKIRSTILSSFTDI